MVSFHDHARGICKADIESVSRWTIPQPIDFPNQIVQMLPSISELGLVVNTDACDDSTTCPLPLPGMWERSNAWATSGGSASISDDVDARSWDEDLTRLMGLEGRGRYFMNRQTLYRDGDLSGPANYLEGNALMLSDSYEATYPGGASYKMNTGFFSLYGGDQNASWSSENGTSVRFNRTLPLAYQNGYIPSMSYGLHVGSVFSNVTGSLTLGGYDSSRMLSDPIVEDSNEFTLNSIGLGSVGGYMYFGEPEPYDNQLTTPGTYVTINPGAPYMYLPRATCDKIAEFLPVHYDEAFNLYLWDKSDSAFHDIVKSLHFLSFGFASSNNRTQKINVPFGVLNLTLSSPLVSEPTPYFPCSPLRDGQTATLGRAFLQAAFLAQNWHTNRVYLSQAPGPAYEPEYLRAIATDDTQLQPATNPPTWQSTWTQALPPWDDSDEGSSLSGGAIAGVVVGIIALLAIIAGAAIWFTRRRKRRQSWTKPSDSLKGAVELPDGRQSRNNAAAYGDESRYAYYKPDRRPVEIFEAEARPPAQEMDSEQQIRELPGEDARRRDWKI